MDFLYFPDDKSEYLPALFVLVILMVGAVIALYLFNKKSKKDQEMVDEKYKHIIQDEGKEDTK